MKESWVCGEFHLVRHKSIDGEKHLTTQSACSLFVNRLNDKIFAQRMLSLRVKKPEKYMLNLVKLKKPTSLIGSQSLRLGIHFQEIKKKCFLFWYKYIDCNWCLAENYAKQCEWTSITNPRRLLTMLCFALFLITLFPDSNNILFP